MSKQSNKANTPKQDKQKVEDLAQRVEELTDSLMRERADSENIRRRHTEQVTSLKTYVKVDTVRELLPVIDNVERALRHVPKNLKDNDYVKGVESVAQQFQAALNKIGVERIETIGEEFNPELHEAVSMDDSGTGTIEVISDELQAGYVIEGHVIRHAMVRVTLQKKK